MFHSFALALARRLHHLQACTSPASTTARTHFAKELRCTGWFTRSYFHLVALADNVASGGTTQHVAKLNTSQSWTATGTIAGDIIFSVLSIGADTAEVEIRHTDQQPCPISNSPTPGTTSRPSPSPTTPGTPSGDLTCGGTFTGSTVGAPSNLGSPAGDHFYALEVASGGTTIVVSTCGSVFDTVVTAFTGSDISAITPFDQVAFNDDHGGTCSSGSHNRASRFVHTFSAGSYIVLVDGYNSAAMGTYTITTNSTCPFSSAPSAPITLSPTTSTPTAPLPTTAAPAVEPTAPLPTVTCGQIVTGTTAGGSHLFGNDANDVLYAFTLSRATTITFDGCQSAYNTYLRILSADLQTEIDFNDDHGGRCGAGSSVPSHIASRSYPAGSYILVVEGYGNDNGEFSVNMQCATGSPTTGAPTSSSPTTPVPTTAAPPPTIVCGQTVTGTTVGGTHVHGNGANDVLFAFTLSRTTTITFDGCQSQYDSYLRILSPDLSRQVAFRDDGCPDAGRAHRYASSVAAQPYYAGSYILLVEGYNNNNGEFSVHMQCVTDAPTPSPTQSTTQSPATSVPTPLPTSGPTSAPSTEPPTEAEEAFSPTAGPTSSAPTTAEPTLSPTPTPTTSVPTPSPTQSPATSVPTPLPTSGPTSAPSTEPPTEAEETFSPTVGPTSSAPTLSPTPGLTTSEPALLPTPDPTSSSANLVTFNPTAAPGTITSNSQRNADDEEDAGMMYLIVVIAVIVVVVLLAVAIIVHIRRKRSPAVGSPLFGVKKCSLAPHSASQ